MAGVPDIDVEEALRLLAEEQGSDNGLETPRDMFAEFKSIREMWDEAKQRTTFLAVSDPFGFRLIEPDLRSLVDEDPTVFYAPHPQVAVECGMCEALREKGIDPITMQPKQEV